MAEEYISRQAAIDAVNHALDRETILFSFVRKVAISALKRLPSADVVPVVHGHWIPYRCDMYECSVCQHIHTSFDSEECDAYYCPNCGAKMRGEQE